MFLPFDSKEMSTATATATVTETLPQLAGRDVPKPPRLDDRFAELKREIIKSEHKTAVEESYKRLKAALAIEMDRISTIQQAAIPEISWSEVQANGGVIPSPVATRAKEAGCILLRGVVSREQALAWKEELKQYTQDHRATGGRPLHSPTFWLMYWTRPQVQARSHPDILAAMDAVTKLWHVGDPSLPIDLDSQIVYADRFRIRAPGDTEYTLKAHLDSSAIERWEDPIYRSCYAEIFEGRWEDWDPWKIDMRPQANVDLYRQRGGCSAFRALQGWLSLSTCGPGEGTLRVLPNVKLVTAYLLLRPFFVDDDDEVLNWDEPTFPGATPGRGQLFPTTQFHPHLQQARSMVSVQTVEPGDYMYWHCDLAHEVEDRHGGAEDSSVFYNASIPLCPYNIENMLRMRACFREKEPPQDFFLDCGGPFEMEKAHADSGAREENILSVQGRRALGLEEFDVLEPGLSKGQRRVRQMANEAITKGDGPYTNKAVLKEAYKS
ncbi:hypothetical protein BJY01DRAFT_246418 [Aspergillus pseudoustus]|uniref:DUF1479-domain-containing protein n=1 Tax=Aspergillus pseudoustus TaxID=1810923 RepID=A0ABR4K7Y6_9EURO